MRVFNPSLGSLYAALAATLIGLCGPASAQSAPARSSGEVLYLPIYSHIWHGDLDANGQPVKTLVSISVSIRNTDMANAIVLTSAQYYDTNGKRLKEYIASPTTIPPLGTHELFIARSDDTGGSGANFIIAWNAKAPVSPPIVEGIHANLPAGRAIIFTTAARPLPR